MATYKVLQDIEAEDTLIGPLTVRQCLYAAIAVVSMYLCFISVVKHAAFLVIFFLPFVLFGLFFAFPWSKQQPTEVWALAKVRFYFKPRVRIWNQTGVKELVTITAPKTIKRPRTSDLSPTEVRSRLKALADTIDSRGWAVKNVDLGYYARSTVGGTGDSDRLVNASSLPQEVPNYDASASADIFDVQNNPVAQKFDVMMSQSAGAHRQQAIQAMGLAQQQQAAAMPPAGQGVPTVATQQPGAAASDYWHMRTIQPLSAAPASQPSQPMQAASQSPQSQQNTSSQLSQSSQLPAMPASQPVTNQVQNPVPDASQNQIQQPAYIPEPGPLEDLVLGDSSQDSASGQTGQITTPMIMPAQTANPAAVDYSGIRVQDAQPSGQAAPVATQPGGAAGTAVTAPPNPAILELANNNDLNVATLAREAQARNPDSPDEVVVSLH